MHIREIVGATVRRIVRVRDSHGWEWLVLETDRGLVGLRTSGPEGWLEDVTGDLADLVGTPLVRAEQVYHTWPEVRDFPEPAHNPSGKPGDFDWTFQTLVTARGDVQLRWCDAASEYYSAEVEVIRLTSVPEGEVLLVAGGAEA